MTSSTNALEPTGVPNTLTLSGFHTSGPKLNHAHKHTDARFHTRVLLVCNRIPACVNFSETVVRYAGSVEIHVVQIREEVVLWP